jgi:hypothetical protein
METPDRELTKEEAYDTFINPLMAQVIDICRQFKIPIIASFCLGIHPNGVEDYCTTAILKPEWDTPRTFHAAARALDMPREVIDEGAKRAEEELNGITRT